jgi:hypothetical protein
MNVRTFWSAPVADETAGAFAFALEVFGVVFPELALACGIQISLNLHP